MKRHQVGSREEVSNRFQALQHSHDLEEQWSLFTQAVKESADMYLVREEDPIRRGGSPPIRGNWSTNARSL